MYEEDYDYDIDMAVCPKCGEEVPDETIYSCEVCGKLVCKLCINKHMEKHHKRGDTTE